MHVFELLKARSLDMLIIIANLDVAKVLFKYLWSKRGSDRRARCHGASGSTSDCRVPRGCTRNVNHYKFGNCPLEASEKPVHMGLVCSWCGVSRNSPVNPLTPTAFINLTVCYNYSACVWQKNRRVSGENFKALFYFDNNCRKKLSKFR